MRAVVTPLWAPRAGSTSDEFEDAFFPPKREDRRSAKVRVAVADGATESLLSGRWAAVLVRAWGRSPRRRPADILAAALAEWQHEHALYLDERHRHGRAIQWFEEPGLEAGAHATFLGVNFTTRVSQPHEGRWSAVAAGDSCLFHLRGGELLASFPITDPDAFGATPALLSSRMDDPQAAADELNTAEGTWSRGDVFILATDAVAAWLLRAEQAGAEAGADEWAAVAAIGSASAFGQWVSERRAAGELRNDDVTLVRVEAR